MNLSPFTISPNEHFNLHESSNLEMRAKTGFIRQYRVIDLGKDVDSLLSFYKEGILEIIGRDNTANP